MGTEANTCGTLVLPKLNAAGGNDYLGVGQQTSTTDRIVLREALKVPPLGTSGTISELVGRLGVANQLRAVVREPQSLQ